MFCNNGFKLLLLICTKKGELTLIGLIKNKKKLIYIAIGVLYILSTPIFSNSFFKLVEGSEYRKPISAKGLCNYKWHRF
jgi:hypothetical protein